FRQVYSGPSALPCVLPLFLRVAGYPGWPPRHPPAVECVDRAFPEGCRSLTILLGLDFGFHSWSHHWSDRKNVPVSTTGGHLPQCNNTLEKNFPPFLIRKL